MSVGGDDTGGEDVVDGGGPGGAVAGGEVGGSGWGDQAVPGRERAWGPKRGGQGVAGAPVLLRSPRRTHRSGRMQERRWFMSLTSETHSEYERRGGRWALKRRARPPNERGPVEAIQCGLS